MTERSDTASSGDDASASTNRRLINGAKGDAMMEEIEDDIVLNPQSFPFDLNTGKI
ncbi:hypothetical protein MKK75_35345 [Methylobacterium sp. J-030]|uniref:hypothetical protein n=1 Tax=Methylobacterium sp. J-030 TaxID=2836627 RepID=UPI001FBC0FB8|nr:hypothetical protein [Methylobacterium sp. J-030]MCJ2074007.1 hypothetical protein [Methylobacterium sp. J-030]